MSLLHDLFGLVCHQIPERSPQFGALTFPLCFRCAGTYLGVFSSYLVLGLSGGWRQGIRGVGAAVTVAILMLPLVLDGWGVTLGLWSSPGWVRGLTGLGAGAVLPVTLAPLILRQTSAASDRRATRCGLHRLLLATLAGGSLLATLEADTSPLVFSSLAFLAALGFGALVVNLCLAARPSVWEHRGLTESVSRLGS
jgi:uncharacterized membrane protein